MLCNVVRNALMLVLERKLTCFIFPSWHNVFYGNVVVPVAKVTHVRFHSPWNGFRNFLMFLRRKSNS